MVRFHLLGFQVQIRPGFWLVALLLVAAVQAPWSTRLMLIAVVLLSLLVHELGHALAARRAGQQPSIIIHAFGGVTSWLAAKPITRRRAIGIALAGPGAGLILAVVSLIAVTQLPEHWLSVARPVAPRDVLMALVEVNGFWSLVNLLPVLPFDGGQVLALALGQERRLLAATISMVAGLVAAALLIWMRLPLAALIFGASGVLQYLAVRKMRAMVRAVPDNELRRLLEEAEGNFHGGQHERAQDIARTVSQIAQDPELRHRALELLAWGALERRDLADARDLLKELRSYRIDPLLQSAVLEADQDHDRALFCLRQAQDSGDARPQVAASLVRLLLLVHRYREAAQTTASIIDTVPASEARQVADQALAAGEAEGAAQLYFALFGQAHQASDAISAVRAYLASGHRTEALSTLEAAVQAGLAKEEIEADHTLDALSSEPRFQSLIAVRSSG